MDQAPKSQGATPTAADSEAFTPARPASMPDPANPSSTSLEQGLDTSPWETQRQKAHQTDLEYTDAVLDALPRAFEQLKNEAAEDEPSSARISAIKGVLAAGERVLDRLVYADRKPKALPAGSKNIFIAGAEASKPMEKLVNTMHGAEWPNEHTNGGT